MIYITTRQKHHEKQISWMDLLEGAEVPVDYGQDHVLTGTITRCVESVDRKLVDAARIPFAITWLINFNHRHADLFRDDMSTLYRHFTIPKKTGGLRPIDAPCETLQSALRELKDFLSERLGIMYHTSAFAYVPGRCITDVLKKHQNNESNWFIKTDFSGFFPSTTLDFTMKMLSMIFPTNEICKTEMGRNALRKALSLGFLNGGLPQGTALSPYLTNVIMIPIDHYLFNELAHHRYVYTRYADDIQISCIQKFNPDKVVQLIRRAIREFEAPYTIKDEKTHFGSRKGRNWMLGLKLNADNDIKIGFEKKKLFKAMTSNFILDTKNGKFWARDAVHSYEGLRSYYHMVEPEYFEGLTKHFNQKYSTNLKTLIDSYLCNN